MNNMTKNKTPDLNYDRLVELAITKGLLTDMDGYCFLHMPKEKKKWALHHLLEVAIKEHKVQADMSWHYLTMLREEKGIKKEEWADVEIKGVPHPMELRRRLETKKDK
jgi:hypothetical protein